MLSQPGCGIHQENRSFSGRLERGIEFLDVLFCGDCLEFERRVGQPETFHDLAHAHEVPEEPAQCDYQICPRSLALLLKSCEIVSDVDIRDIAGAFLNRFEEAPNLLRVPLNRVLTQL